MIKYPVFFADALQELQINQVDIYRWRLVLIKIYLVLELCDLFLVFHVTEKYQVYHISIRYVYHISVRCTI